MRNSLKPGLLSVAITLAFTWPPALHSQAQPENEERGFERPKITIPKRSITVDGQNCDWKGIPEHVVETEDRLWFGQGMTRENWNGPKDLSYRWKVAWDGDRIFFWVDVTDDRIVPGKQPYSYLSDCIEIYVDYRNQGGTRVVPKNDRESWFDEYHKEEMRGYELHFLPTVPVIVNVDHRDKYSVEHPQTDIFHDKWQGETALIVRDGGYSMEIGFSMPHHGWSAGDDIGLELGVCDDDGDGRKSIMMWTGTKSDFWITMDEYGKATFKGDAK